ncbi:cytochrome c oxidase subunit 4 [Streptomyces sp. AJS327]|uniref:aa3-type cytochrome oxidase subunit IV n=1 Tax=Streptomyces sp. AJS327 TaxID=2545265 RepID=UPI0015DDBBF6|nr:cytochrome c oxidase subunit 4 [Streptomyces sp. AJS327]MBA0053768.1 cytochrome c oxidase subunit 4 [Streptomyces sp. AJS327]
MRTEAVIFAGVALFFAAVTVPYALSARDPAGTAALLVAVLMAALIATFLAVQYGRRGARPEDRRDGEIRDRAGPVDFFPPRSPWPVVTALGVALTASGVVVALWLLLVGVGVTAAGVSGFALQYASRRD